MKKTIVATLFFAAFSAHAQMKDLHVYPISEITSPIGVDDKPNHWYQEFRGLAAGWMYCKQWKCYDDRIFATPSAAARALMGSRDFNLCNMTQRRCEKDGLPKNLSGYRKWIFETASIHSIEAAMSWGPYNTDIRIEVYQRSLGSDAESDHDDAWYQPLNGWYVAPTRNIDCEIVPLGESIALNFQVPLDRSVSLIMDVVKLGTETMPAVDFDDDTNTLVSETVSIDGNPDGYYDYEISMTNQPYKQCEEYDDGTKDCVQTMFYDLIDKFVHPGKRPVGRVWWALVNSTEEGFQADARTMSSFGCWEFMNGIDM